MEEKKDQNSCLPYYDGIILLLFTDSSAERKYLLRKEENEDIKLIRGQFEEADEQNPLAACLRLLRSDELKYLIPLCYDYTEADQQPLVDEKVNFFTPFTKICAKWIVQSVTSYPRLTQDNYLVIPLFMNKETSQISQHSSLRLLSLLEMETQAPSEVSLVKRYEAELDEGNFYKKPYFGLIDCQIQRNKFYVTALHLIGSLLNDSDRWLLFCSKAKQLPPTEDLENMVRGVAFTGSPTSCYDETEWTVFLKQWTAKLINYKNLKILGTCYGHQMVAQALGGSVKRNVFIRRPEKIVFNDKFFQLPYASEAASSKLKQEKQVYVQELHGDEVVTIPEGFEVFASSESCAVECMGKGNQILTFQGHPEITKSEILEMAQSDKYKLQLGEEKWKQLLKLCNPHKNPSRGLEIRRIQYSFLHSE